MPTRARSTRPRVDARMPLYGGAAGLHTGETADPFAINPIRRSLALVAASSAVVLGPLPFGEAVATTVMLSVGWLAIAGLVMGLPILVWSLAEAAWRIFVRRIRPSVEQLDLAPRLIHILQRHGFESIEAVDRTPDPTLLLLSNMDTRGLREVRRAISLWKYRRWQDQGFPATGYD